LLLAGNGVHAIYDISERASSYDMANEVVDGQDVLIMHAAMERAVERARADKVPTLLEVRTYRFMGHSMSDPIHGHYRTKEEVEDQRKRDPIAVWSQRLIAEGLTDEAAVKALDKEVIGEVNDAYQFADEAPEPGEVRRGQVLKPQQPGSPEVPDRFLHARPAGLGHEQRAHDDLEAGPGGPPVLGAVAPEEPSERLARGHGAPNPGKGLAFTPARPLRGRRYGGPWAGRKRSSPPSRRPGVPWTRS